MTLNARAVKMVRLPEMHFIGARTRLNMKEHDNVVEKFWADKFTNGIASLSFSNVYGNRYGVIKPVDEFGNVDYYAAVLAPRAMAVPADAEEIDVLPYKFACLNVRGPDEVSWALDQLFNKFLKYDAPDYKYNPDYPCIVVYNSQTGGARFPGVDVYVPAELENLATS